MCLERRKAERKTYRPPNKFCIAPFVHMERSRLYSDDRTKYPCKRGDFDPNGDRHPENSGKAGYECSLFY